MLRLKKQDECPPDGFRYTHETGYVSRAIDIYNWYEDIKKHRKANQLVPISVEQAMDQLCRTIPPQWCEHDTAEQGSRSWVSTRLTWGDIVEGTKAYVSLALGITKPVDQSEANRRAKICSSCYLKSPPSGCGSCLKIGQLITGEVAKRTTPYDFQLVNQACSVCRCSASSIIHFPMSALDKADSQDKQNAYPDFCWRKQGGINRVEELA